MPAQSPLRPDDTSAHEAQGCGSSPTPRRLLTLVIEPDGLHPLCSVGGPQQELKIVNDMVAVLHGRARVAHIGFAGQPRVTVPVGAAVLFIGAVDSYLAPGEHKLYYSAKDGPADIWLKSAATPVSTNRTAGRSRSRPRHGFGGTASPPVRACTVNELHPSDGGKDGASTVIVHYVKLRNISSSTCWLRGYPHLVGVRADGDLRDVADKLAATDGGFFTYPDRRVALAPGQSAAFGIETADAVCVNQAIDRPTYQRLFVRLPGDKHRFSVPLPPGGIATCGLYVTRFVTS